MSALSISSGPETSDTGTQQAGAEEASPASEAVAKTDANTAGEEPGSFAERAKLLAAQDAAERKAKMKAARALLDSTRAYAEEDRARSWLYLASTLLVFGGFMAGAIALPAAPAWYPVRALSAILAGLTTVRLFIFYHDYLHLAIFRKSWLAKVIMYTYGMLVLVPPQAWRDSHNYHHANTAKIVGSHVGSYAMVTVSMWEQMSTRERVMYRLVRHPLTMLFGYFTVFMLGMCLSPFLRAPKKNLDALAALLINWTLTGLVIWKFGFVMFFLGMFLPLATSMAVGAYLFYAQHNFPEIEVQPRHEWSFTRAALESSSFMKMGPIMNWFTGNIGYHHVHHLNPTIPFYRLPDAMAGVKELQNPPTTSLGLRDVLACFRLKLWDPDQHKMVGYP
jgi:omega-6 fatty acid desaturase (delta-12 desaturase)